MNSAKTTFALGDIACRAVHGTVAPIVVPLYRFCWGNNSKRATMQGRVCRVICRGTMNSAMIEFTDNGQREVVSRNALRRHNATGERPETRSERTQ
jgi:hypothetical protein